MCKISVIIPIYKAEGFIEKCVASILNQTYKNLELILVDDGSPDNCPKICDDLAKKDSRVIAIHQKNQGHVVARSNGFKHSKGEYIIFVDADDWLDLNMLEDMMEKVKKYNCDVVSCDAYVEYENKVDSYTQPIKPGFYNKKKLISDIYPVMLYDCTNKCFGIIPTVWNKLCRRSVVEHQINNINSYIKIGEDVAFTYPIMLKADSYYYLKSELYHYRITPGSLTKRFDPEFFDRLDVLIKELMSFFSGYDMDNQMNYYKIMLAIGGVRSMCTGSDYSFIKKRNNLKELFSKHTLLRKAISSVCCKYFQHDTMLWAMLIRHRLYTACIVLSLASAKLKR